MKNSIILCISGFNEVLIEHVPFCKILVLKRSKSKFLVTVIKILTYVLKIGQKENLKYFFIKIGDILFLFS